MITESYLKCSDVKLHLITLDHGCKKHLIGQFPIEVFYVLEGQAILNQKNNSPMMFQNGNILELRAGEEAEILSYSTLEIVHLALPHQLKSKTAFEDMGRQIAALQYCTKNKLSEISALNKNVLANMQKEGICLHASHDFGLSKPESVSEDSKAMFKKILKTYLNNQRN